MGGTTEVVQPATPSGRPTGSSGNFDPRLQGGIGAPLEELRRGLIDAGRKLEGVVEPAGRSLVTEAARLLDKQVCRIAVVGQIKAGKSTFVNAFAQSPALLPTDVNPWTTAVTNLHFRQRRDGDPAARFTFFTEEEWQRIAEGGGLLRELTERLVPGFEPELLRQHVTALRRRAAGRLGPDYGGLLGQEHVFPELSTEILQRYVCAGDATRPAAEGQPLPGQFSDITCAAHLQCPRGPFDFPSTVIDTPGTNDPFLLRDEITRRALESADLYIVVLTARQPLSEADVALLRILRGLHKERIIVFVNRIDDLQDISRDLSEVMDFVRRRIAREFPDTDIPIIPGSARWASGALHPGDSSIERSFEHRSLAFFTESGLMRREDLVRPAPADGNPRSDLQRALFVCSGLPAVYSAVNELMGASHCAYVLRQVAQCYLEMARASDGSVRSELSHLKELHATSVATAEQAGRQMRQLDNELRQLQEVSDIIDRSGRSIEEQMNEMIAEEIGALRSELYAEVDVHAAEERDVLIDTLRRGRAPREWKCEAVELRRALSGVFNAGFRRAAHRIGDLQARVTPELRQLLSMIAPRERPPREPDWGRLDLPTPAVASLSTMIAIDLDQRWWTAFWSRRPKPEERGAEVEGLIRSEFEYVVEELVSSAEQELSSYATLMTKWSFGICHTIIEALHRRRQEMQNAYQSLSATVDGRADPETVARQQSEITRLSARLAECEAIESELEVLCERYLKKPRSA